MVDKVAKSDTTKSQLWQPLGGEGFPWPVYATDRDTIARLARRPLDAGKYILSAAELYLDSSVIERSLWCGFNGTQVLANRTFGSQRRSTYGITTKNMRGNTFMLHPVLHAFSIDDADEVSSSRPVIASYDLEAFNVHDPADGNTNPYFRNYELKETVPSLDTVTNALFVAGDSI